MPAKALDRAKIVVENVNVPGYTVSVDAAHYESMKKILLKILPKEGPGLTQSEMHAKAERLADPALFPGRETVGWWMKCVHLDLEAKGILTRDKNAKPLRWRRLK